MGDGVTAPQSHNLSEKHEGEGRGDVEDQDQAKLVKGGGGVDRGPSPNNAPRLRTGRN